MKKVSLKKKFATVALAISTMGIATVAGTAPASADSIWKYTYAFDGYGRCVAFAWHDYSWAEEVFQGKKDGPLPSHYMNSNWCRM